MLVDTVVKNCRLVLHDEILSAGLAIDRGKIVEIAKEPNLPRGDNTIDCKGNFVLPGLIDPHVHLGAWFPFKDDCITETKAAALGGTTTVLHHLTNRGSYLQIFDDFKKAADENSVIDIAFHFAVMSNEHLKELEDYVRLGTTSFKFFMAYRGEEGEQIGISAADDGLLFDGFQRIGLLGYPVLPLVHAENVEIAYRLKAKLMEVGRKDLGAWSDARPNFCEDENIRRASYIAKTVNSPLYIVHVSSGEGVESINKLKASMDLYAEATPHHLTLTKEANLGALGKVAPPLRDSQSVSKLWWGIRRGAIDCIGSDHVPVTKEKKNGDIWRAPPGLPSIGLMLPLMITEGVRKNRITLEKVVELCSYNTARIFGFYPRKGSLGIGSDADLCILDLSKRIKFKSEMLPSVADFSPYEGMELIGWPQLTMVRGNIIVKDGQVVGKPGTGDYISRQKKDNPATVR